MPSPLVYVFLFASVWLIVWALINLGWFESLPFCSRKVSFGTAVLLCLAVVACSTILLFDKPKPSLEEQLKKWACQNGLTVQKASDAAL